MTEEEEVSCEEVDRTLTFIHSAGGKSPGTNVGTCIDVGVRACQRSLLVTSIFLIKY